MEKELRGQALHTHCEMAVLRLLVESIVTALPVGTQDEALRHYSESFERTIADLLAGTGREELLSAMERAKQWQDRRLESLGHYIPPPHGK